jgi:hypothetical protein
MKRQVENVRMSTALEVPALYENNFNNTNMSENLLAVQASGNAFSPAIDALMTLDECPS